ncbi:MAG: DeoR/GlpR transcriptional regulator [Anaerolineaceae bacterium]|nr:DeoR/GlpR transcriptional regulator [Anaerolineaceae bacterium]
MTNMEERLTEILRLLDRRRERVDVRELAELTGVSTVTIRNDLNTLAREGKIKRVHGGAVLVQANKSDEYTFKTRQRLCADQKYRIGTLAASLVHAMDVILLDSSTTALAVGQVLQTRSSGMDITIVTTGIWTAIELMGTQGINVVVAGGNLRSTTGSLVGPLTRDFLRKINIRRAFLGAWGVTLEEGFTDTNLLEVELKQMIVQLAEEVIVVLDSSKFGEMGIASFAAIDQVHCVITDDAAPASILDGLRAQGVEVMIAR